jgi:TolB-like protein
MVTPFNVLAESGHEWIGKAVAEGLAGDLQKAGSIDATTAAAAGDSTSGANWTITGSVQILEDQMRIDARVTRAADGVSKSITASGGVRDLFALESNLAQHAQKILVPAVVKAASAQAAAPSIEIAGPPTVYQSTYFNGDLTSELAIPNRFTTEQDRYNYQPTPWALMQSVGFVGCGSSCGGGGGCGLGTPAAPVSGW